MIDQRLTRTAAWFRVFHTVVAVVELAALVDVWASAWARCRGPVLRVAVTALAVEAIALVIGRGDCPLGPLQRCSATRCPSSSWCSRPGPPRRPCPCSPRRRSPASCSSPSDARSVLTPLAPAERERGAGNLRGRQAVDARTVSVARTRLRVRSPRATSVVLGEWLDRPIEADLAVAVEADRLGYREVWIGEMAKLDAPAMAAAIVARTTQIEPSSGRWR